MNAYRFVLRVVTISGRVLPARSVRVSAESEAEALTVARGVCQLLERGPVNVGVESVTPAPAVRFEDLSLERAVALAVTGEW